MQTFLLSLTNVSSVHISEGYNVRSVPSPGLSLSSQFCEEVIYRSFSLEPAANHIYCNLVDSERKSRVLVGGQIMQISRR